MMRRIREHHIPWWY